MIKLEMVKLQMIKLRMLVPGSCYDNEADKAGDDEAAKNKQRKEAEAQEKAL